MNFKFITLSLLLHIFIFFNINSKKNESVKHEKQIVEIELNQFQQDKLKDNKSKLIKDVSKIASHKGRKSPSNNKNNFKIGKAIPSQFSRLFENNIKTYNQGHSDLSVPDNPYSVWGSGATELERLADYSFMERIYERVNNNMYYPGIFAYKNISGTVNARLVLSESGECNWQQSQISQGDINLRVYILSVLKKTCAQDLKMVTQLRSQFNIDMSFTFELTERSADKDDANKMIIGNVLNFYRNSGKSKLEWNLGPLKGIFPLPVVNLDLQWLQLNWDKYINNKDSLKEFIKDQKS